MRRTRRNENLRNLCRENQLNANDLIWPVFLVEGENKSIAIEAMPNIARVSLDGLAKIAEKAESQNINALALFPVIEPQEKTLDAKEAWRKENLISRALQLLKKFNLLAFCDVALDPYTTHGHDGIVSIEKKGKTFGKYSSKAIGKEGDKELGKEVIIDNELTLKALAKQALALAESGADVIAPSDMMDGRVGYLRGILDAQGFQQVAIASYAAKFASNLYSPFREALKVPRSQKERMDIAVADGREPAHATVGVPSDKKSYQMDYANSDEALWEIALDANEGADMLIVKPAVPYLDIVYRAKQAFAMPILCYHVSGEYAAIASAAKNGYIDEKKVVLEQLTACKRAGASAIISYYAPRVAEWLQKN